VADGLESLSRNHCLDTCATVGRARPQSLFDLDEVAS